jgi:hypothetical protein
MGPSGAAILASGYWQQRRAQLQWHEEAMHQALEAQFYGWSGLQNALSGVQQAVAAAEKLLGK